LSCRRDGETIQTGQRIFESIRVGARRRPPAIAWPQHITSGRFLTQGADCAEDFTVLDAAYAEPGTVLVIDDIGSHRHQGSRRTT
jgi:hypothetical protein